MKCPCKGCDQRHEACWSKCEKYKEWRAPFDKKQKEAAKSYAAADYMNAQTQKRIKILNKRK